MLKINSQKNNLIGLLKKFLTGFLYVAHCNIHSNFTNAFVIRFTKQYDGKVVMRSKLQDSYESRLVMEDALKHLASISRIFGCHVLKSLVKGGPDEIGYHIGCSLPMRKEPKSETESDIFGRPKGFNNVHIIDSSIFNSLPATTIGLLAMANASRIADIISE